MKVNITWQAEVIQFTMIKLIKWDWIETGLRELKIIEALIINSRPAP